MIRLRDGSEVADPRLGRLREFDPRSRQFPVMALLDVYEPRSYTWACDTFLDQGREGACVGFAWAHENAARPVVRESTAQLATEIYREAQRVDQWEGEAYEGTSVLAGAKTMMGRGLLREYRWAFNLNDALTAVSRHGPGVAGLNWYESMFDTDADGFLRVHGMVAGGHAILVHGVNVKRRTVTLHNSWGVDWGRGGRALLTWDDFGRLLDEDGELCLPVAR